MIVFTQISDAEEIRYLSSYYILKFRPLRSPDGTSEESVSVSMLQITNYEITRDAVAVITKNHSSEEQVAFSISRLVIGSCIVAEKEDLVQLRHLLEKYGHEGEIRFLPLPQFAAAVFPALAPGNIEETATQLHIPVPEEESDLTPCLLAHTVLRRCQIALGAELPLPETEYDESSALESKNVKKRREKRTSPRISNRTLKRVANALWSDGPWLLIGITLLLVFFAFLFIPHKQEEIIDRNQAPKHYLVLSWDKTGKYGTRPKKKAGVSDSIQFRIPYGVYTVWNNNSVPVDVYVVTENEENISAGETETEEDNADNSDDSTISSDSAVTLSASQTVSNDEEDEGEENDSSKVIMRPNSNRQITVDKNQYVTLSDEASNLIFFYESEVPEEKESDTTGNEGEGKHVVYAYVKGTEVRFRKAPSLEGQIINALSNGAQVQVLGVTGEWTHVIVGDQKGYIFSQYLSSEDPSAMNVVIPQSDNSDQDSSSESPEPSAELQTSDDLNSDAQKDDLTADVQTQLSDASETSDTVDQSSAE